MRSSTLAVTVAASAGIVNAAASSTLSDICTTSYIQQSLPDPATIGLAVTLDSASVTANAVSNATTTGNVFFPDATISYCNVTFTYSHTGREDSVLVQYWLPAPANFQGRYLSTGGGGYAINSQDQSLPGGIIYGASAGITDGGFGGFTNNFDTAFPLANGTANYDSLFMFGYQAHHELSLIGKQFTKNVFAMGDSKLYSYYQVCGLRRSIKDSIIDYSRDALRVDVKDGVKSNVMLTNGTVLSQVLQPCDLLTSKFNIFTPT